MPVAEGLVYRVPGRGTFAAPREEQYLRQFRLRIDRVHLSTTGHRVESAVSYFLPEHYFYRVRLRRNVR